MRLAALFTLACLLGNNTSADVQVSGVSDLLEKNVLAHLKLDDEACDQDPAKIRYRYDAASAEILAALKPYGYYHAGVDASFEQPADGCWQAGFAVELGEPVRVGKVRVEVQGEGAALDEFQSLISATTMVPGAQLNHGDYERLKNQLLVTAKEMGFFDAVLLSHEIRVQRSALLADISLVVDTGVRYRFGALHVDSDVLQESLLLRYVRFQHGAPFEQRRIRELQNDLVNGDFFSSVDVRTEVRADKTVDVFLDLEEGRRIRYGVGVGFGTDTGLIVRGDAVNRRVNRRGHRLELDAELSKVRQNATFDYRIPGRRPQKDWYSMYGGLGHKDSDALESYGFKLGIREYRYISRRWNSAPFLEWTAERFLQNGDWQLEQVLVPGYGLTFRTANADYRPTQGIRLHAELAGASTAVASDVSFLRLRTLGKAILPLSDRGRLLFRGEAGWMVTKNFEDVPPSWRFFAGGDNSVRGYDYQALGPVDDEGNTVGGERVLTGSVEADWRFRERWSGAIFVDAGNVGEDDLLTNLPWSVGIGARWYSPVGPIRLDLAFPQVGGNSFRIHISMGPDL